MKKRVALQVATKTNDRNSKVLMIKVVLLGDPAVGKTSLIQRFVHHSFSGSYKATLGLDLSLKEIKFPRATVKLQLWDMGGQSATKSLRLRFYKGTRGALLVYDTTRRKTFQNLQIWLQELEDNVPIPVPFIVLGNKGDLKELGAVTEEEENSWANNANAITHFRTSAKTGTNVEDAFRNLAEKILTQILQEKSIESDFPISYHDLSERKIRS